MSDVLLRAAPRMPRRVVGAAAAPRPAITTMALWMRRTHLYSGLLMLPFVLIYGVSAFLFNHGGGEPPAALPGSEAMRDRWSFPADALAREAAGALGWDAELVSEAHSEGDWTFEFREAGATWRLTLPLGERPATLRRTRASTPEERVPVSLFATEAAAAERAAGELLAANGRSATELRRIGAPSVRFDAANGEASVSLQRGQVTRAGAFDFERLLMRLHTTHGYTTNHWARTVWAVVVDLMAAAMVLWTVSGVWMWWQKRSHRRSGGFALLGGVVAAVVLGVALAIQFG
jgi:hypothetical protein